MAPHSLRSLLLMRTLRWPRMASRKRRHAIPNKAAVAAVVTTAAAVAAVTPEVARAIARAVVPAVVTASVSVNGALEATIIINIIIIAARAPAAAPRFIAPPDATTVPALARALGTLTAAVAVASVHSRRAGTIPRPSPAPSVAGRASTHMQLLWPPR